MKSPRVTELTRLTAHPPRDERQPTVLDRVELSHASILSAVATGLSVVSALGAAEAARREHGGDDQDPQRPCQCVEGWSRV
jgi:hypothetical protein